MQLVPFTQYAAVLTNVLHLHNNVFHLVSAGERAMLKHGALRTLCNLWPNRRHRRCISQFCTTLPSTITLVLNAIIILDTDL
jgi:hypothetical protein